jgi:hypothetical protein
MDVTSTVDPSFIGSYFHSVDHMSTKVTLIAFRVVWGSDVEVCEFQLEISNNHVASGVQWNPSSKAGLSKAD